MADINDIMKMIKMETLKNDDSEMDKKLTI